MFSMKKMMTTGSGLLMLAVAVIAINVIASKVKFRLDATSEKVFSLSPGTKSILEKLSGDVTAKFYFSRSMKELPVPVKTYATRVEEVLAEYAAKSGGKLHLEVFDPKPDTDDEEMAQKYGINGVRLPRGDAMYFGVVFVAGAKEIVLPYLDPRREEFLEYDLSETLVRAFRKDIPTIGIMSSLPVMGGGPSAQPGDGAGEAWVFVNDLRRNFTVKEVPPNAVAIDDDVKILMIVHPKDFADSTLYAIDQFVLRGGRLIAAVDPMSRIDLQMSGMAARSQGQMPAVASDLDKLFKAWGVQYDKTMLVGDNNMATQINAGGAVLAYPMFLTVTEQALQTNSPVTSNLKQMLLGEAGNIALAKDAPPGVTLEPLIKTTKDSGAVNAIMTSFMAPQDIAKEVKFDGNERILAGLLKGKFKTAFPGGKPATPPPASGQTPPEDTKPALTEGVGENAIVLIADTDFLADQNAADKFRFGGQVMVRARNDNLNFIANAADFLGGSQELISIRSRGRIARPFTRIQEIQAGAQKRWQAEEETLTKQLTDLQKKLAEIQQQRTDDNRFVLTPEQQRGIDQFREEERAVKVRRREVRKNLREDIEHMDNRLTALNLLILPLASTAFGATVSVRRGRKKKRG